MVSIMNYFATFLFFLAFSALPASFPEEHPLLFFIFRILAVGFGVSIRRSTYYDRCLKKKPTKKNFKKKLVMKNQKVLQYFLTLNVIILTYSALIFLNAIGKPILSSIIGTLFIIALIEIEIFFKNKTGK